MPKISETEGRRDENSGYSRLFGNQELGHLISRTHATVIRTGTTLEHILREATPLSLISDYPIIVNNIKQQKHIRGKQVVFQFRNPATKDRKGGTIDVLIFDHESKHIILIELKDGDTFDTKKASGELDNLVYLASALQSETGYHAEFYFCSFNQNDKNAIVIGAKGRFSIDHAMTGRELSELLEVDYDNIRENRKSEQRENLVYFISELLKITPIKVIIQGIMERETNTKNGKPST
jgi:hypothetical protein